ncbi:MAG: TIGR03792 family protein [Acidimicrobiales bacterium]
MVIEMLTFDVGAEERVNWLQTEERVWSRFLERQAGFIRKQMWVDREDPGRVHALIWWESYDLWKQISPETVAEIDEMMGPLLRESTMRTFDVVREC